MEWIIYTAIAITAVAIITILAIKQGRQIASLERMSRIINRQITGKTVPGDDGTVEASLHVLPNGDRGIVAICTRETVAYGSVEAKPLTLSRSWVW